MLRWGLGPVGYRCRGRGLVVISRLGPTMVLTRIVFPEPIQFTTEVRIHLTFFTIKHQRNILLIRQNHAILPTLPLLSPIFLKLLSGMALHFRAFCYRLTRKCPPSVTLRRGFRNCRVICYRLPTVRSLVEVLIDVSPPVQYSNLRSLGPRNTKRKPIRLNCLWYANRYSCLRNVLFIF